MSEELSHTEDMTIEDFLSGATAYEIADNALISQEQFAF